MKTRSVKAQLKEHGFLKWWARDGMGLKKLAPVHWEGKCVGWRIYTTWGLTHTRETFLGYIWKPEKEEVKR